MSIPTFKKTEHILTGYGEYFDINWFNYDEPQLPPRIDWDYQRELRIEDVFLWEVITEPWEYGVYAAWDPYGELYVIRKESDYEKMMWDPDHKRLFDFEVFYGQGAQKQVVKRMNELGIHVAYQKVWVPDDKLWLY